MGSGKITKNQINLDLIKIFQFCLKFDICGDGDGDGGFVRQSKQGVTTLCSWVGVWVVGWMGGLMGGVR